MLLWGYIYMYIYIYSCVGTLCFCLVVVRGYSTCLTNWGLLECTTHLWLINCWINYIPQMLMSATPLTHCTSTTALKMEPSVSTWKEHSPANNVQARICGMEPTAYQCQQPVKKMSFSVNHSSRLQHTRQPHAYRTSIFYCYEWHNRLYTHCMAIFCGTISVMDVFFCLFYGFRYDPRSYYDNYYRCR